MNIEENKEYFKTLCKHHIKREGINDLLNWLEDTDFYTAPASTKYHLAVKGGLCQHSLNVFHMMVSEVKSTLFPNEDIPPLLMEEVAILALFHDFVKINFYEEALRNVKTEFGEWIKVPYFSINNKGELFGHGVVSARMVSKFITLTDEEFMAITYHMGFSGEEARTNPSIISGVFNQNIMALLLNIADMKATFWEEREV